ncbi:acyl carrier protein [Puniceicoccaceae bacterium K14]|nr:acyl carrier protein [Puniceicoccaceae bacterium K14]
MSDIKNSIIGLISELANIPKDEIKPESELVADLGIDSPKALQLLVEIEDALGIEISDENAEDMNTVGDVIRFCEAG